MVRNKINGARIHMSQQPPARYLSVFTNCFAVLYLFGPRIHHTVAV